MAYDLTLNRNRVKSLTFGADPEVFIFDNLEQEFVPSNGLVLGTKEEPYHMGHGYYCQKDGLAAEFNTPKCKGPYTLYRSVNTGLRKLQAHIDRASGEPNRYSLKQKSIVLFSDKALERAAESDFILGCDPDFDAASLCANETPSMPNYFRTAGAHIHIGWGDNINVEDKGHFASCAVVVQKIMSHGDLFKMRYGRASYDNYVRSLFYGSRLSFRPKSYGVEIRGTDWGNITVDLRALQYGSITAYLDFSGYEGLYQRAFVGVGFYYDSLLKTLTKKEVEVANEKGFFKLLEDRVDARLKNYNNKFVINGMSDATKFING